MYSKKFVLIYNIKDFHEMGGGLGFSIFSSSEMMDAHVSKLLAQYGNKFEILHAFGTANEFFYGPVRIITELKRFDSIEDLKNADT